MSNVIYFKGGKVKEDLPDVSVDLVLDVTREQGLARIFIVGVDDVGEYWYASSSGTLSTTLWDIEQFKRHLLESDDED